MAKKPCCTVCGVETVADSVNGIKYKKKTYCIDCFYDSFPEKEVNKHFFYVRFQDIFKRVPSSMEWTQCERFIKESNWDWVKLDCILEYVYQIEGHPVDENYGAIGILPFFETRAKSYFNQYSNVLKSLDDNLYSDEVEVVRGRQISVKPPTKKERKSIDGLINWDEEEDDE